MVDMLSVKVSTKHQIAVPSEARKALGIKAGDRLTVEITPEAMIIKPRQLAGTRLRGTARGCWGDDPEAWVRTLRDELERGLP